MKFLICIVRRTFRAAGGHIGLWDPLSGLIREAGVTPRQTSWLRVRKVIFPLFSSLLILVMISFEVKAGESGEEVVDEATAAEMAAEGHAALLDETLFPSASQCAVCHQQIYD